MKVIFLDVDGVLNNFGLLAKYGFDHIDEYAVLLVANLVKATGAKIVLSSTWRLEEKNLNIVKSALGRSGIEIWDCTPRIKGQARSIEIQDWLRQNIEVERFVILDDDEDAGFGLEKFIQTDPEIGITDGLVQEALEYLGVL